MPVTNVAVLNGHNLTEILLEEDEEENWNDNSSVEEDKNTYSNNNLNSGDGELNVPNSVKDAQISLKMDIYTIKDFVSQIEELKTLYDDKLTLSCTIKSKMKRRRWSNGFLSNDAKKYNSLESMFKEHWEEAAVIIDLSEIAQDREPMFGGGKHVEVDIENIPDFRISVEVMPSLVEHLRKLQERLTEHVNELKIIAKQ
ncbi:8538_t:CDS:2 [Entrophospora sp. SA101]|nr:8950_t:CDS:2 [Entrophospora sp. SA101]CAJ0879545.1 8538_t:CDS:2 [Entrophospora sp. SA101]